MPKTVKNIAITIGYAILTFSVVLQGASLARMDLGTSLRAVLLVLALICFFASFWRGLFPAILSFTAAAVGAWVLTTSLPNLLDMTVSLGFFWIALVTAYRQEIHSTEFGSAIHAAIVVCVIGIFFLSIFRIEHIQAYLSTGFGLDFSKKVLTSTLSILAGVFAFAFWRGSFLLSASAMLPICVLLSATFHLSPLYLCYVFGTGMAVLCYVSGRKEVTNIANAGIRS